MVQSNFNVRGALAATMLFYEVTAWLLAVRRAWRTVREDVKFWDNPKQSLNYIIFSQGLIYISAVFLLSVCSLALNFEVNVIFSRLLNSVKVPLSGLLTARFLIELRKWERSRTRFDSKNSLPSYDPTVSANIHFANRPNSNASPQRPGATTGNGTSVIQELGRDIGPKPRSMESLLEEQGEGGELEVQLEEEEEERAVRKGKARESWDDEVIETSYAEAEG
ncbi:hypothetical protein FA13DRAFT_1522574 [Coprinellus micaceus]|uniref:Uncharacterized protein n=1 Tax=Coprinellus micaceus TaxID=71717 RepID=A0A4Y7SJY0_COPMI|nr:hypothetical protein FA13DRAFT_1522574 [Coprinellus micaceus]